MPSPGSAPSPMAPQLLLLSMMAIWGGSYAAVKTLLDLPVPPFVVVALRFLIAVLCLWPMLPRGHRVAALAATWKAGVPTGAALLLGYALQTLGMRETTSSMGGFLSGLIVLLVAVGAWAVFGERLRAPTLAGLGLGAIGLVLLCFGGDPGGGSNSLFGIGLQIASSTSYAAHVLLISRLSPRGREDAFCLWQLLVVALGAMLLVPATGGLGDWRTWGSSPTGIACTLYLGLLATALGIAVQSRVQPRIRPGQVAVLFATQPAFAAAAGLLLLGDRLGAIEWTGGALIAIGVVIGGRGRVDPACAPPRPRSVR